MLWLFLADIKNKIYVNNSEKEFW